MKRTESIKKEVVVFGFLFVGLTSIVQYLQLPYPDELSLLSGLLAVSVSYLVRPIPEEGFVKFAAPLLLLVFGGYLIAEKGPKLLSGWVSYPMAGLLCLAIYVSLCMIMIKKRRKIRADHGLTTSKSNVD